jgi:sulfate adenylyltransferase subunit 1
MSALRGENVVFSGRAVMPWYAGPSLIEVLELATQRSSQTVGFRLPVQRVSRPHEGFRGYQGTVAGGSVKPGDSIVVLPSGTVANVRQIVTFDLVRNAAVAGDAITLVLDRPVDIARGDMIAAIDAAPATGRAFEAKLVALSQDGIDAGKRYWLKAGSRRQRVVVEPQSVLDLASGSWEETKRLGLNAIGKVHLSFDEPAIFDSYEANRHTGSFILIDPDSNNTVAGGMILARSGKVGGLGKAEARDHVVIALPEHIAERLMASDTFAAIRDHVEIRRVSSRQASSALDDLDQASGSR